MPTLFIVFLVVAVSLVLGGMLLLLRTARVKPDLKKLEKRPVTRKLD